MILCLSMVMQNVFHVFLPRKNRYVQLTCLILSWVRTNNNRQSSQFWPFSYLHGRKKAAQIDFIQHFAVDATLA